MYGLRCHLVRASHVKSMSRKKLGLNGQDRQFGRSSVFTMIELRRNVTMMFLPTGAVAEKGMSRFPAIRVSPHIG